MDKKEEWVHNNTNMEENITIGYNYVPWRILLVIAKIILKTILLNHKNELNFLKRGEGSKLEIINKDK